MQERKLTFNELPDAVAELSLKLDRIEGILNKPIELSTSTQEQERLLTRQETAEFFKISLYTIHDWVKRGILKPYKAGNRTYFKRSELLDVINQSNNLKP